jgi:hypothetical protein
MHVGQECACEEDMARRSTDPGVRERRAHRDGRRDFYRLMSSGKWYNRSGGESLKKRRRVSLGRLRRTRHRAAMARAVLTA